MMLNSFANQEECRLLATLAYPGTIKKSGLELNVVCLFLEGRNFPSVYTELLCRDF